MKKSINLIFVGILIAGFGINPVFVMAKNTCYVDKTAKYDGDGSSKEPYKKISKALDKGCKKIIVDKGTYKDSITLGSGVKLEGKSRDGVVITGKIKMKNKSELDKVTVSGSGIDVDKGADVDVENSKIKDAHIGIETLGNGTLTVEDTSFSGNRKALYLQRGKNVKITGCKVYNNSEEGIDIRSNVDGIIRGNEIYSNGESGIEVILGKSDLRIENNSIKKNRASGIATQFYKEASKIGGVSITGNTITGNKDYGINCKIPSGGSPSAGYWSDSLSMHSNKISDNKDGNFAPNCFFDEDKTTNANKTKEQLEQEQKEAEVKKKKQQQEAIKQEQEEEKKIEEKQQQEEKKIEEKQQQEEKKIEEKKKKQQQTINAIQQTITAATSLQENIKVQQQAIEKRPDFLIILMGPDFNLLGNMVDSVTQYNRQIEQIRAEFEKVPDGQKKKELQNNITNLEQQKEQFITKMQEYNNTFSIYKWIVETFKW